MTAVNSTLAAALSDRYLIERELGRGGMATVYLARDLRHDRPVALKLLHPELGSSTSSLTSSKQKMAVIPLLFLPR